MNCLNCGKEIFAVVRYDGEYGEYEIDTFEKSNNGIYLKSHFCTLKTPKKIYYGYKLTQSVDSDIASREDQIGRDQMEQILQHFYGEEKNGNSV